jgi:hypothetical protein
MAMARYMLAIHSGADDGSSPMTDEDRQRTWAAIGALEADMKAGGAWALSVRMDDPAKAVVVRSRKGRPTRTDGPYAETKEHLGGFYVIEAADLEGALAWAERVSEAVSMPIEVRALAGWAD